jgi:molecular chaperone DnaK (HSP70)
MTTRIGIDFGTANTVVAGWNESLERGEPIPLPGLDLLREGAVGVNQRVIPSLIMFDSGGRRIGAQVAAEADIIDDPRVFRSTKSVISGRVIDVPRDLGYAKVSNREAATRFLSDVMANALLVTGPDVEIVATAPVEAFDTYRDWLVREVSEEVSATRIRVVDEATAAAVGYSGRMHPGDSFLVFDFGAGTLDVSVVIVNAPDQLAAGSGVRAVSKAGADIGGDQIDLLLTQHILEPLRLPTGDTAWLNQVTRRTLQSAERAKARLTREDTAAIEIPLGDINPVEIDVTRSQFETLLRDSGVIRKINSALHGALNRAAAKGVHAEDLSNVYMVGGSSLIPAVRNVLLDLFPSEIVHLDRPLEAVASGAAGIAGGVELMDHIQHDYAIRHVNPASGVYEYTVIVHAGTEYPTLDPIAVHTIRATRDGQHHLGLAIFEMAHATYQQSSGDLEIMFDAQGGARAVTVTPQSKQEKSRLWLNEDSPTFLEANPPGKVNADRFRLEFRIDAQKRLTVSAFDLERRDWVLQQQPVVRLA